MIETSIIIAVVSSVTVVISLSIKYFFQSKCKKVTCCGATCIRDTIHEHREHDPKIIGVVT